MASIDNHPAIITAEVFERVQQQRIERSNMVYNPDGTKTRKGTHYSTKQSREKNNQEEQSTETECI